MILNKYDEAKNPLTVHVSESVEIGWASINMDEALKTFRGEGKEEEDADFGNQKDFTSEDIMALKHAL
jgi:hypothetical protein